MDSFFFLCSKLFWLLFSPDILMVLALVFCLVLFWFRQNKKALILLHLAVFSMVFITIFPVGQWLLYPLETRFSIPTSMPKHVDGIIVLGGAEQLSMTQYWKLPEIDYRAERLTTFVQLSRQYPKALHVFAGGIGSLNQDRISASDVASLFFKNLGMNLNRIIFENQSKNTFQNALFTQKKVHPSPGDTWILITSAAHMPRSIGVFNKIGWPVIPYPVDHKVNPDSMFKLQFAFNGHMRDLKSAVYQWTGLIAYYLAGKTSDLLPKSSVNPIR